MTAKSSSRNISLSEAYAPPVPAATAAARDPLEPLTVYSDGTLVLPRQLTHDNIAREVKLNNLAKELKPDFEGVETEDNWGRRETNIIVLRRITNSAVPEERTSVYISTFRGLIDGIVKSATSLRTSLSLQGTTLIQEAVRAVGPGLDQTFDILYPALEKQSLTKPAQAQAANSAMITLLTHLSFHSRIIDSLSTAMESKNKALRGYVIGWLESLIRHCAKSTLESHIDAIEKILRKGLSDADGTVREKSRAVFWTYAGKFKTRADIMYESLPKQSQKSLDAANSQGVLNSKSFDSSLNRGPPPPRPATSHADRSSLKQFIKDKKKEAKKVESTRPLVERPKSAAPGHERNNHELSSSTHSIRKPMRGADVPLSRPESAASTNTIDRAHGKQSSQDLKRAPRKQADLTDDQFVSSENTRIGASTPHAQRKAVRRPAERPDSGVERPKSSASIASTAAPMKPVRPTTSTVPIRPKMATSASTSSTGTLSSAPKRPNFNRKAVTSTSTSSVKPTINIPPDHTADLTQDTVPSHIAHVITPPRGIQDPLPLQVLANPPDGNSSVKESQTGYKEEPKVNHRARYDFTHDKAIDPRSITCGTLNVMASLISDPSNAIPSDAFEVLSTALEQGDVHVRRAGMDLCLALWNRVDDPMVFWSQLEELQGKTKSFLMYWINKEKRAV